MATHYNLFFASRKLEQDLKLREVKLSIVNQQCVVHHIQSCDLCDAIMWAILQHVGKHKHLAIGKHFLEGNGRSHLLNQSHFNILTKFQSKFDCLLFEVLYIKKLKLTFDTQTFLS